MNPQKGYRALRFGRVSISHHYYLLTFVTDNRIPIFTSFELSCLMARSLNYKLVLKDSTLLAWVIMPDHVHILIQLGEKHSLSNFVRAIKATSTRNLKLPNNIWSRGYHDQMIRDEKHLKNTARYIVANPLRSQLVNKVGDYPYWNAIWI